MLCIRDSKRESDGFGNKSIGKGLASDIVRLYRQGRFSFFFLVITDIEGDSIFIQTNSKRPASLNQMQRAAQKCFMHGILQIMIPEGGLAESHMHM